MFLSPDEEKLKRPVPAGVRVPHHHISVGPGDNAALPRVQIIDLSRIRARYGHETILVHLTSDLKDGEHH